MSGVGKEPGGEGRGEIVSDHVDSSFFGDRGSAGASPSRVPAILSAIVAFAFAGVALSGDPSRALSRSALPALVALVVAIASIGAGAGAIRLLRRVSGERGSRRAATREEIDHSDPAVSLIIGLPLLGMIQFLVALVSTSVPVLVLPVAASAVFGAYRLSVRALSRERVSALPLSTLPLFAALLLTAALMSLLPAVSLDEVSYHLAIPRIWVGEGSAIALPLMSHSFFPMGTESAALLPIAMLGASGAISSHIVHLLIAIAASSVAIRAMPEGALSTIGVVAIASTPAILLGAGWSGTDVPLVACSLVLFLALDRFLREGEGLATAAAAMGAGLLVKYTFIPIAGILFLCALASAKADRAKLVRAAVAGGVLGSVFFIRNLILSGNPVEPFLSGGGAIARFRWAGSWGETVVSYLFDTRFIDDSLGFILPGLALGSIAVARAIEPVWRRNAAIAMLVTAAFLTIVGPSGRILLPFLVVPGWIALSALVVRKGTAGRVVAGTLLIVASLLQLGVSWLHLDRLDPLAVVSGQIGDSDWVARHRRSQALVDQGNQLLDPTRRTLVLGVNELFWYEGRVVGGANFDSLRVSRYLSGTPADLRDRLRHDRIESILVYPQLLGAGVGPGESIEQQRSLVLTPEASSNLLALLEQHATLTSRERNALRYDLE